MHNTQPERQLFVQNVALYISVPVFFPLSLSSAPIRFFCAVRLHLSVRMQRSVRFFCVRHAPSTKIYCRNSFTVWLTASLQVQRTHTNKFDSINLTLAPLVASAAAVIVAAASVVSLLLAPRIAFSSHCLNFEFNYVFFLFSFTPFPYGAHTHRCTTRHRVSCTRILVNQLITLKMELNFYAAEKFVLL